MSSPVCLRKHCPVYNEWFPLVKRRTLKMFPVMKSLKQNTEKNAKNRHQKWLFKTIRNVSSLQTIRDKTRSEGSISQTHTPRQLTRLIPLVHPETKSEGGCHQHTFTGWVLPSAAETCVLAAKGKCWTVMCDQSITSRFRWSEDERHRTRRSEIIFLVSHLPVHLW